MSPPLLLLSTPDPDRWRAAIAAAAGRAGLALDLRLPHEPHEAAAVRYAAVAPTGPLRDLSGYPGLRAILSLWAGVEKLLAMPLPPGAPLCRMVDAGLREGMRDYVVGHVMRLHLGLHAPDPDAPWGEAAAPLARDRPVTVLGLGEMGGAAAAALAGLGFPVTGWSRGPRDLPGLRCLSGPDGLRPALAAGEIVVALLPRTPQTDGLLDAAAFAAMRPGAALVNAGRGEAVDDAALLAALASGRLSHAVLDVFREEPLPAEHPFRRHPRITVTPHVAAPTRPETAAEALVAQILRAEAGAPLLHVVDRARGY